MIGEQKNIGSEHGEGKEELPDFEPEAQESFPFYRFGMRQGVMAGLIMGVYLLLLSLVGLSGEIWLDFLKYLVLAGFIGYSIREYKRVLGVGHVFKNGMLMGAYVTVITAITVIAFILITYFISGEIIAYTYNFSSEAVNTAADMFTITGMQVMEVHVFGMIATFIWLQWFKTDSSDKFKPPKEFE